MEKTKIILCTALIFAVVFAGCTSDENSSSAASTGAVTAPQAQAKSDVISIPVSDITETAKWFEYESSGATIKFFAVNAGDGSIKTAFDACDVCFSSKKGYRQEKNTMICNNCGNKYPIDSLGTENKKGGGCWPGYLPSKVIGDNLVIEKSELDKGGYRFA